MTLAIPHPLTIAEQSARESAMHWYTLAIDPQCWRKIGERAKGLGYETYCPMGRYVLSPLPRDMFRTTYSRKVEGNVAIRPLFGSYMFVSLLSATSHDFNLFRLSAEAGERPEPLPPSTLAGYVADPAKPSVEPIQGCRGWICGPDGPTPLHEAVIERLRRREASGEFDFTVENVCDGFAVPNWYRLNLTVQFIDDSPWPRAIGKTSRMIGPGICDVWLPLFKAAKLVPALIDWIRPVVE